MPRYRSQTTNAEPASKFARDVSRRERTFRLARRRAERPRLSELGDERRQHNAGHDLLAGEIGTGEADGGERNGTAASRAGATATGLLVTVDWLKCRSARMSGGLA